MGGKGRGILLWTILLIVAASAATLRAAGAFSLVPVAYTGQSAPGATGGATYSDLGSSSGPWPTIDQSGRITFRGVLGFPSSGVEGLWNGTPAAMSNLVFEGQPTPDNPTQTFNFSDSFAFFLHQQRGGLLTYDAQYRNPDLSVGGATWLRLDNGTSTRILYDGMPLPAGTSPAGAVFSSGRPLVYVAPDGGYAFRTTLQVGPGGVSSISNTGIWSQRNGGALTLIARQGFQAPGAPAGVTLNGLSFPIAAAGGTTIFRSSTSAGGTGVWKSDGTTTSLVALTGQPAAGLPSGVLVSSPFNVQPHVNDSGNFPLFATLSGSGVTASNNHAIWLVDPGGMLHLAARSGTSSPAGGTFTAFYGSPQLDNSNRVIFGGITSTYQGLFRSTPGGLQTIAITGTQAPGNAPGTKFTSIDPPEANGAGWALFDADLTTAGGALVADQLFAVDPTGIVSYVAGLGTFVDLGAGGVQEIRHAYRYSQDVTDTELTQLNDQNQAVFFATFTNGGAAVVTVSLPEPAGVIILASASLVARRRLPRLPRRHRRRRRRR
jgi:hypothetical protein